MKSLPEQAVARRALRIPPLRFRLWWLFFITLIVAVICHSTMEQIRLTDLRMKYHATTDAWISGRVPLGQVISAADELLQAERSAFWVSDATAYRVYVERLSDLAERGEKSIGRRLPNQAEQRRRDCVVLRDLIKRATIEHLD